MTVNASALYCRELTRKEKLNLSLQRLFYRGFDRFD